MLHQPTRISQENYFRGAQDAILAPDGSELERRDIGASLAVTWTAADGYLSVGIPWERTGSPVCGWRGACTYTVRTFDGRGAVVAERALMDAADAPFDQVEMVVQTADGGCVVLGSRQNR